MCKYIKNEELNLNYKKSKKLLKVNNEFEIQLNEMCEFISSEMNRTGENIVEILKYLTIYRLEHDIFKGNTDCINYSYLSEIIKRNSVDICVNYVKYEYYFNCFCVDRRDKKLEILLD